MIHTATGARWLACLLSLLLVGAAGAQQPPIEEDGQAKSADATKADDAKADAAKADDADAEKADAEKADAEKADAEKADAEKADAEKAAGADDHDKGDSDKGDSDKAAHAGGADDHDKGADDHDKGEDHAKKGEDHAKGEGGHGEHDPYDLSAANATSGQENILEWKFDMAFFTLVVFLLLLAILLKFAWGPIVGALDKREGRISALIDEAEKSAEKARQEQANYERKLAEAHLEAEQIVNRATQAAQQEADQILADAKAASRREKDQAVAEIEVAKNEALGEVTERSVDIALSLAKEIVSRELNEQDHDALVKSALDKFPT